MEPLTVTVPEAAKLTNIGINELYWHCNNDPSFPCFKVGKTKRKILIPVEGLKNWLEKHGKNRTGCPR